MNRILIILLGITTAAGFCFAEDPPDTAWTLRYGHQAASNEMGWGCAVDTVRGLFYLSGSVSSVATKSDVMTLKMDAATGIILDSTRYDDSLHLNEWGYACAADAESNYLYVSGVEGASNDSWMIIKYDAGTLVQKWRRFFHIGGTQDFIFRCRFDPAGQRVFLSGYSNGATNADGVVLAADAVTGDSLWCRRYCSVADSDDAYLGLAVDGSGFVYCGGVTNDGINSTGLVTKCSAATGDTAWQRTYASGSGLGFIDLALDPPNSVIYTVGGYGPRGFLAAFGAQTGDTLWSLPYRGTDSSSFYCCIVAHNGGILYAAGSEQVSHDSSQCLIVKYNVITRDTVWSKRIQLPNSKTIEIFSCDMDGNDDLYMAGRIWDGNQYDFIAIKLKTGSTGVAGQTGTPMLPLAIARNEPNPFSAMTSFGYRLSTAGLVSLCVYNIAGQRVRTLVSGVQMAGGHQVKWDGADESGTHLSAGIYFYRLSIPGRNATGKMTLVR